MDIKQESPTPRQTLAQIFAKDPFPSPYGDSDWTTTQQINLAILNAKVAVRYGTLIEKSDGTAEIKLSFRQVGRGHLTRPDVTCLNEAIKALAEIAGCHPNDFKTVKPLGQSFFESVMDRISPDRSVQVKNKEAAQQLMHFAQHAQFQGGLTRPEMQFSFD